MKGNEISNIDLLICLGAILCLFGGVVLLAVSCFEPIKVWGVLGGVTLLCVAWRLAMETGIRTGRREGRLEEREKDD